VTVTPEESGLVGCWQVIAVERLSQDLTKPDDKPEPTIGYYATSLEQDEYDDREIGDIIRGHWAAIENGTHHRRDVTFGEDGCTTKDRTAAPALACVRNLVNGIYELERAKGRTKVDTLASWCQQQTFTTVWKILKR
jgi:hypothetical protein